MADGLSPVSSRRVPSLWRDKGLRLVLGKRALLPAPYVLSKDYCLPWYYPFDHETVAFGGKIRRYKYEHGLSNEKLVKVLGVDETTVADWERNSRLREVSTKHFWL